jgi:hypothetical protein
LSEGSSTLGPSIEILLGFLAKSAKICQRAFFAPLFPKKVAKEIFSMLAIRNLIFQKKVAKENFLMLAIRNIKNKKWKIKTAFGNLKAVSNF